MNKYQIRTHKKKTAIVYASFELFRKNGFTNTSVKQIASAANVSQVSIYNYFGSKDALVLECVKLLSNDAITRGRAILNSDMSFKEKLLTGCALLNGAISLTMQEYFSASLADDYFMQLLNTYIRDLETNIFADYIEAGKKEGVIPPSIPTETILKFISSFHTIELNPKNIDQEIQHFHRLFLYGILGT